MKENNMKKRYFIESWDNKSYAIYIFMDNKLTLYKPFGIISIWEDNHISKMDINFFLDALFDDEVYKEISKTEAFINLL